jgi:hypothetical protein
MIDANDLSGVSKQAVEALQKETADTVLAAFRKGITDPTQLKALADAGEDAVRALREGLRKEAQQTQQAASVGGQSWGGRAAAGLDSIGSKASVALQVASVMADKLGNWMRTAAGGLNIANNRDMAGFQKTERLVEMVPVVGNLINSFRQLRDAVDGTTERMRQESIRHEQAMLALTIRSETETGARSRLTGIQEARAGVAAYGAGPAAYNPTDRSTGRGAIDYAEEQQRLASADNADMARRQAMIDRQMAGTLAGRVAPIEEQLRAAHGSRTRAAANVREIYSRSSDVTSSGNRADLAAQLNQVAEANQRILALEQQRRQAADEAAQAGVRAAQSESQARRAVIEQMRTELSILRDRERSMVSAAQTIARATPYERDIARRFGEQARSQGIESLLPQQRQIVEQFFPNFAAGELARVGEQDPLFAFGRDVMGEQGSGGVGRSIAETRGQVNRVQAEVRNEIILDQAALADEIVRALGPALATFIESMRSEARARASELTRGRLVTINSGGS